MAQFQVYNLGSLNLKVSPFLMQDGDLIRAVNVVKDQVGMVKKRPGYIPFLGTTNGSAIKDLFYWDNGASRFLYNHAGGKIFYHDVASGTSWVQSGNGTTANHNHLGFASLDNTLLVSQDGGTTRHTTNGTTWTDTPLAPAGGIVFEAGRRGYIANGTSSSLFYSTSNDISNWNTTGTSDSSSLFIPGPGYMRAGFEANDRAVAVKSSGKMFTWDTSSLRRVPTNRGFTSQQSIAEIEDYKIGINPVGVFGYNGNRPQLISNSIEKQIYNDKGTGISGPNFGTAGTIAAASFRNDYYLSVGQVAEDLTYGTLTNAILKYDFQMNEWWNYDLAHRATAMTPFTDANGNDQLLFGASNNQAYQFAGTALTDNGTPIQSVLEFLIHAQRPGQPKQWNRFRLFANPGCEAQVQIGLCETLTRDGIQWIELGDMIDGFLLGDMPAGSRSRLAIVRIVDSSYSSRFHFYGFDYIFEYTGQDA